MAQKVKPLKMEDTTSGGDLDMIPVETKPSEDYVAAKGLALENLDTYLIDRSGNDIQFTDPTVGTKSVDSVRSTARVSANDTTPSFLFSKLVPGIGISLSELNDGANETLSIINNSGNFGDVFTFNESESESSTTSSLYQEKLKLTTPSLDAGSYYLSWYYEVKTDTGSNKTLITQVQRDDTEVLSESDHIDTRGNFQGAAGFDFLTLTAGVHFFDIDYKVGTTTTATIKRARMIIWRIA